MTAGPSDNPWWHTFFDEAYADFGLADLDDEKREELVSFLLEKLHLSGGDRLFDQCCGVGRLSLPIAERGIRVIGVDRVAGYVDRARRKAGRGGLPAEFHCADAFDFTTDEPCDAAVNWFTSFGYDEDDAVNRRMFERAFESLRPGGRLALDYLSIPRVCAAFRSRFFHLADHEDPDGLIVLEEPTPDFRRGMIDSAWTFVHADGRRVRREVSTRMYMPHEIVGMLRGCGFADLELYGSVQGEPFDLKSLRCIAVARRP